MFEIMMLTGFFYAATRYLFGDGVPDKKIRTEKKLPFKKRNPEKEKDKSKRYYTVNKMACRVNHYSQAA